MLDSGEGGHSYLPPLYVHARLTCMPHTRALICAGGGQGGSSHGISRGCSTHCGEMLGDLSAHCSSLKADPFVINDHPSVQLAH